MLSEVTTSRTTLDGEPELMMTVSSMPATYGNVGVSATDEYAVAAMADSPEDKKYDVVGGVVGLSEALKPNSSSVVDALDVNWRNK